MRKEKIIARIVLLVVMGVFCFSSIQAADVANTPGISLGTESLSAQAQQVAQIFYQAWLGGDFAQMYGLLCRPQQEKNNLEKFTNEYHQYELINGQLEIRFRTPQEMLNSTPVDLTVQIKPTQDITGTNKNLVSGFELRLEKDTDGILRIGKIDLPIQYILLPSQVRVSVAAKPKAQNKK